MTESKEPTARDKFTDALRKLVSVPKAEIVRREKEYKAARKQEKTRTVYFPPGKFTIDATTSSEALHQMLSYGRTLSKSRLQGLQEEWKKYGRY